MTARSCTSAHPRSRGENRVRIQPRGPGRGSSPLTRGKQRAKSPREKPLRLIPAHAGKTRVGFAVELTQRAHPRSRGENQGQKSSGENVLGSSPLTRGKPHGSSSTQPHPRLIPAHAGKTLTDLERLSAMTAHPRSRGENAVAAIRAPNVGGSSPLTRGKRLLRVIPVQGRRLIPAHAGKTRGDEEPRRGGAAHPRSRGENKVAYLVPKPLHGSSPLTRGKLVVVEVAKGHAGLIPAHAGKT